VVITAGCRKLVWDCTCGRLYHLRARRPHRSSRRRLGERNCDWLNHRSQVRAGWVLHAKSRRQILYGDFIEDAAKCYIDALQHDEADTLGLVGLYAKLSGMRAVSSKPVIQRAEDVARKILDTYLKPDKSFVELREMAVAGTIDLLQGFSDTCHDEFEDMRPKQF
jgi:hypothetical protein